MLEDFRLAVRIFPADKDLRVVLEVLRLSQDILTRNPEEFPSQLIGRLHGNKASIVQETKEMLKGLVKKANLESKVDPLLEILDTLVSYISEKNEVSIVTCRTVNIACNMAARCE